MAKNKPVGGCVGIFLFLILFAAVVWALAIGLWILGLAVMVGGVLGAGFYTYHTWRRVSRAKELQAIEAEVVAMTQEAAMDLRNLQVDLARIMLTKGIGTKFQEQMAGAGQLLGRLDAECEAANQMCDNAPSTEHRVQAIANAERVRMKVREAIASD